MSKTDIEQAEISAVRARLKRFVRPASEATNYHDPERLERLRQGRQHAPRIVGWAELGRNQNSIW